MAVVRLISFDEQDFSGVILATVLYFCLQELFMCNQVVVKMAAPDLSTFNRFDYSNKAWECADRAFCNLLEQTPFFITMMWVFALFCGAESSIPGAYFYIGCRFWFPVLWAVKGKWTFLVELSTQPCYGVLNYWKASLAYLVFTGDQLADLLPSSLVLFVLVCVGLHVVITLVTFALGKVFALALKRGFPEAGSGYAAM